MPYRVRIAVEDVAAAHFLPGYPGNCAGRHGHSYAFEAVIEAERLHEDMVVDFALVKGVFKALDHTDLNADPELASAGHRPTAEWLATVLAARLQRLLERLPHRPRLVQLTVRESPRSEVTFTP